MNYHPDWETEHFCTYTLVHFHVSYIMLYILFMSRGFRRKTKVIQKCAKCFKIQTPDIHYTVFLSNWPEQGQSNIITHGSLFPCWTNALIWPLFSSSLQQGQVEGGPHELCLCFTPTFILFLWAFFSHHSFRFTPHFFLLPKTCTFSMEKKALQPW